MIFFCDVEKISILRNITVYKKTVSIFPFEQLYTMSKNSLYLYIVISINIDIHLYPQVILHYWTIQTCHFTYLSTDF